MACKRKDSASGLTDEELEKLAIEELMRESKNPVSGQKRKRLDVAAHRMVLNSLSFSTRPKRSSTTVIGSALAQQQRLNVKHDQGEKNASYSEEVANSGPKRMRHPS